MSEFEQVRESELIAALRKGLGQSDPVPSDVAEFAKASYTWRSIEAELAELEYDSAEEVLPSGVRSSATARMISFQVGQWMLDIEYDESSGRLMGAISPGAAYAIDLHSPGALFTTESDEVGRFTAEGISSGPLSMVLRFHDGGVIKTQWVVL